VATPALVGLDGLATDGWGLGNGRSGAGETGPGDTGAATPAGCGDPIARPCAGACNAPAALVTPFCACAPSERGAGRYSPRQPEARSAAIHALTSQPPCVIATPPFRQARGACKSLLRGAFGSQSTGHYTERNRRDNGMTSWGLPDHERARIVKAEGGLEAMS